FGHGTNYGVWNFDPISVVQDPNVPNHGKRIGGGGAFGSAVDDGIKSMYQDELTIGVERLLGQSLTVGLKGTYRSLGRVVEDRCDLYYSKPETGFRECAFINPGSDGKFASGNVPVCESLGPCTPTGAATPEARRIYRGIEILARHAAGDRLWIQASYIYSSL